ncbi:zinc finger protein OZF [Galendromus occidentalis]|uniref:Zinc finger protein OZF n=1 Tax=Galendromus occidentalis TaxID=34638 RepID=A0AAJ7PB54_9ACAR|nr:zinc finger protein OZF [Galendromus occidentalis]
MKNLRPAKRKRKGKQTTSVVAASEPETDFDGSIAQIIISDNLDEITMAKGNCITRPDILVIHENEKVHLVCEEILPDLKGQAGVESKEVNEVKSGRSLKCSFCEEEFVEGSLLTQHVKENHDDLLYDSSPAKIQHKGNKSTNVSKIECNECGKQFSEQDKLQAHMFVHTGTKQFECEVCKRRCLTKAHLDQHMSSHERDGERYYCDQCDKMFAKKTNYKHHLKLHSGVKPYACDVCHKKFATKQYLQIHHRSHSTDKPFVCDICGRGFQFNHVLVDHVRTHTGETPYVCEVCGMSFKVKRTLKRHMKTHLDERPHTCDVCNRGFKVRATLREHMKTHSNEKPYQCHLCGLAYKRNVELRKHACLSKLNQDRTIEETQEAVPIIPLTGTAENATIILQPMTSQTTGHFGMFINL